MWIYRRFQMKKTESDKFFEKLGSRCRELRLKKEWTQEDMIQHGFATRHYQRIEQGLPISLTTALRLAKAFGVKISSLLKDLD